MFTVGSTFGFFSHGILARAPLLRSCTNKFGRPMSSKLSLFGEPPTPQLDRMRWLSNKPNKDNLFLWFLAATQSLSNYSPFQVPHAALNFRGLFRMCGFYFFEIRLCNFIWRVVYFCCIHLWQTTVPRVSAMFCDWIFMHVHLFGPPKSLKTLEDLLHTFRSNSRNFIKYVSYLIFIIPHTINKSTLKFKHISTA